MRRINRWGWIRRVAALGLAVCRAAEERASALWFKEGPHVFIHHLSAVFGYRELLIVKPMRF